MKRSLIYWKVCFEESGLHTNVQNTEALTGTKENYVIKEIKIKKNEHVRKAFCVKYLGFMFTSDGDKTTEI